MNKSEAKKQIFIIIDFADYYSSDIFNDQTLIGLIKEYITDTLNTEIVDDYRVHNYLQILKKASNLVDKNPRGHNAIMTEFMSALVSISYDFEL